MDENFRILKPFLRGLPIVVLTVVLSAWCAKKYLGYVTPMYESTAMIRLADIGEGIPNSNLFRNLDVFASANKIAAEIEVLKSSELLGKTLKGLDFGTEIYRVGAMQTVELYNNSPITIQAVDPGAFLCDTRFGLNITSPATFELKNHDGELIVSGTFGKPVSINGTDLLISKNKKVMGEKKNIQFTGNYEFELLSEARLLDKINKNLDIVSVDKDVPVIRINLKSNVPGKASRFVNTLAQTYIYDYIENKYQAANTTIKFLNQQITEAGLKLARSENDIENYRNVNSIVNIKQETETDLRKISQLKVQQTNLKMNLEAIDELNRYVVAGKNNFLALAPNFEAFTDLLSTEIIKNIKKLQADKKDLLLTFTQDDERVQVIDAKITDLTNYLAESIKNTRINQQIKYDQISRDIREAEAVFETVPGKEKNMTILGRDFDLIQSNYNFLNEKRIEAEIAQAAKISFHRVITPAVTPKTPISPNRPIIIILAALLGLLGAIASIYVIHFMKAKVNDVYSIEQNTSIPLAITTPFVTTQPEKVFDKNALQLMLKGLLAKGKIITFTSHAAGEGKGFNLVSLCRSVARQNQTILIIDAQGDLAALKTAAGSEGICDTCIENVQYVDMRAERYARCSNDRVKNLMEEMRNKADFIIVNNEFLNDDKRALLFMNVADSNLFVVDARKTPLKSISQLELLKNEFALQGMSFLLNRAGYNPSVIREIVSFLTNSVKSIKK
jgi:uncharacterized protein involved in exopolysaccharide biosynthesis